MNNEDLIEDEIYVGYIGKNDSIQDKYIFQAFNKTGYKNYIVYDIFSEISSNDFLWEKVEEATLQEKEWLLECIKQGKFVPCPNLIIDNFEIY